MVIALVLAEVAAGGTAALWVAPLWGRARPSFFKLAGGVLTVVAVLAWTAARAPLRGAGGEAHLAERLLGLTAALAVIWQVLLWAGARTASRAAGIAVVPASLAALVAIALIPGGRGAEGLRVFQLVSGALFAGAVTDGLLLGHWYLIDRRLSREPLRLINALFLAGCPLVAAAVIAGGTRGGEARPDFSPLLGVGFLTVALAVGLDALCALMGSLIHRLVKEDSIQAATGFFYLAVIMALAAEFAAKVRFF